MRVFPQVEWQVGNAKRRASICQTLALLLTCICGQTLLGFTKAVDVSAFPALSSPWILISDHQQWLSQVWTHSFITRNKFCRAVHLACFEVLSVCNCSLRGRRCHYCKFVTCSLLEHKEALKILKSAWERTTWALQTKNLSGRATLLCMVILPMTCPKATHASECDLHLRTDPTCFCTCNTQWGRNGMPDMYMHRGPDQP